MKKYFILFITMLKIGLFTFGGGYAMISLLEHEFIEKKKWIDKDSFLDMIAIAESTPGPLAINSATYIGYSIGGFLGSLLATVGVVIPSFIIIFIISLFFEKFMSFTYVAYAFKGIQVGVIILILGAGIRMLKKMKPNIFNITIFCITYTLIIIFAIINIKFSSVYYILATALIGLFIFLITNLKHSKEERK